MVQIIKTSLFNFLASCCFLFNLNIKAQTQQIKFKPENKYPEGIAFNNKEKIFLISSVKTGAIGKVDAQGNYKTFYTDTSLKSSYGMKVDSIHNLLWVCTGDANYSQYSTPNTHEKLIRLIAIDLSSGRKKKDIDLSNLIDGKHFANDLAFDKDGNIYVTDSYSPVIYKIDKNDKATVFANSEMFKGQGVALNGIAYHPNGYLIVVNGSTGSILKINIANPTNIEKVKMAQFFPGADGILWNDKKELALIQNKSVDKIFTITSNDDWNSAQVKASTLATDRFKFPSAGAIMQGNVYILNSKLNELQDPTMAPSNEWSIQLGVFRPVE